MFLFMDHALGVEPVVLTGRSGSQSIKDAEPRMMMVSSGWNVIFFIFLDPWWNVTLMVNTNNIK